MLHDSQAIQQQGRQVQVKEKTGCDQIEFIGWEGGAEKTQKLSKWKKMNLLHPEREKQRNKLRYAKNPESARARVREWRSKNPERYLARVKEWQKANPERVRAAKKRQYHKNPELFKGRVKQYAEKNKKKINARKINRIKTDHAHAMRVRLSSRLNGLLKKIKERKTHRTMALVGCTKEFLRDYLQGKFKRGMTWDNRSKWHIDHIIPCASFDFTDPEQQRRCFHYTNLQPLWGIENIKKGAKIPPSFQPSFL